MTLQTRDFEVRLAADGDEGTFSGYAAVFGVPNNHDEIVKRGAFRKTLSEHRQASTSPAMFWMHRPDEPIGTWTSIVEDERGLKVEGKLVLDTVRGREAHALMRAGALRGLSIGFRARASERGANGLRVLSDIQLVEISLVSLPSATSAQVTNVRGASAPSRGSTAAFLAAVRQTTQAFKG